jgi:hypothetical protein
MGFATAAEVDRFFDQVVAFEQFLVDDNIHFVKLWLSVGREEQTRTFAKTSCPTAPSSLPSYGKRASWRRCGRCSRSTSSPYGRMWLTSLPRFQCRHRGAPVNRRLTRRAIGIVVGES